MADFTFFIGVVVASCDQGECMREATKLNESKAEREEDRAEQTEADDRV